MLSGSPSTTLGGSPSTMLSLAPRPVDRAGWRAGPVDRAGWRAGPVDRAGLVYLAILAALRAVLAGGAIVVSDCGGVLGSGGKAIPARSRSRAERAEREVADDVYRFFSKFACKVGR
jgi:hypothetical protein